MPHLTQTRLDICQTELSVRPRQCIHPHAVTVTDDVTKRGKESGGSGESVGMLAVAAAEEQRETAWHFTPM